MENEAAPATAETITEPSTAVVSKPRPSANLAAVDTGVLPILPTTIEEAKRYASGMILAGIVPDAFRYSKDVLPPVGQGTEPLARKGEINEPLVLMGVLKSMELGVAPQTGLAGLLPLNGRFSVWGDLAAALAHRHGLIVNQTKQEIGPAFDESLPIQQWPDDFGIEVRYWRVGHTEPYVGRFTVRDAKRAHLWANTSKQPWILYPKRMLFNRARAFALRDGFADGLQGLSIAEEVMDHVEPEAVEAKASANMAALTADETDNNGATNGE